MKTITILIFICSIFLGVNASESQQINSTSVDEWAWAKMDEPEPYESEEASNGNNLFVTLAIGGTIIVFVSDYVKKRRENKDV